ncbi:MAG TPA: lanthionine synthetase LanC family protein [Dongiaceae bacterium]|nr:lanthionine synthetase LanC family protein [Dongiaceae bacterium]
MESAVRAPQPARAVGAPAARRTLLDGARAARALDVAQRILGASIPLLAADRSAPESIGRYGGAALVAESLARAGRGDDAAVRALLRDALVFAPDRLSLYDGAAGLLVVLDALDPQRASLAGVRARLRAALDASLTAAPPGDPGEMHSFDLVGGVAGRAVALAGDASPQARAALGAFAHAFADVVEARFASSDENVAAVNLGLAHGVPGILAALNFALPGDAALARRYVELLLARAHVVNGAHRWGAVWRAAERPSARRAWCYQTVGVAAVLHDRARLDDDASLRALAANALAGVLDDPEPEFRWDDALCHGRAGVASIASRFAAADARFARHAERLARTVLDDFDERAPLGYRSYNLPAGCDEDRHSFLDAALGVAQFLIDAATAQERRWLPLFGLLPD